MQNQIKLTYNTPSSWKPTVTINQVSCWGKKNTLTKLRVLIKMNLVRWENVVNHQCHLIMANKDSHAFTWRRIKTVMASLLNEVIVITHPANPAKLCSMIHAGYHLAKSIELMGLNNQPNLPVCHVLWDVTKRNFNMIWRQVGSDEWLQMSLCNPPGKPRGLKVVKSPHLSLGAWTPSKRFYKDRAERELTEENVGLRPTSSTRLSFHYDVA